MTPERAKFLRENIKEKLTPEELAKGWFFCCEWDGMLIHKTDPEAECCTCIGSKPATFKERKWPPFGIRPLWVKIFLTGVFLIAASFSAAPAVALGGFLVGITVALWR